MITIMMIGTAMVILDRVGMNITTGATTIVIMVGTLIIEQVMIEEIFSMAAITLDQVDDTLINITKISIG